MITREPSSSYFRRTLLFWTILLAAQQQQQLLRSFVVVAAPSWEELDDRPLAPWYDEAKFGIFLHWGVFSVPSFTSEWFWNYWESDDGFTAEKDFVQQTERPGFTYQEYAPRFHAEFYNATQWAELFANAGAQYVVLTSKHHEGFCMWNSTSIPTTWNWNVMDVGPKRDVLGELAHAVKDSTSPHTNRTLKFGIYHSLYEWYNPLYLQDRANNFTTQNFVDLKSLRELYDLVERYAPEIIWSDGEWEAHSDYWRARDFLDWYSTKSSVAQTGVWNDRWGTDTLCHHGAFLTCTDRYQPDGYVSKKWEDALTIDTASWGYNRRSNVLQYMTVKELIHNLIEVISKNGNMLLNVGPASDGTIHPIYADRLLGLGQWLQVNGAAIYGTTTWKVCQNETSSSVFYTRTSDRLFVHVTKWPSHNILRLECPKATHNTHATLLGSDGEVRTSDATAVSGLVLQLPPLTPDIIPCQHAWVVALTGVSNLDGNDLDDGNTVS